MDNLINKYFNQSASREEIEQLLSWIKMNKENEIYFLELRNIWYMSEVASLPENRVYTALTKANRKITLLKREEDKKRHLLWVAASIALLVIFSTGAFFMGSRYERDRTVYSSTIVNRVMTGENNRISVTLPDGSVAWLNSGSTLSYPEEFDTAKRCVKLEGEGYFEVAGDETAPFWVESGDISVKVLGTCFDVRNYSEKEISEVILLSGKVEVFFTRHEEPATLTPGHKLSYHKETALYDTEEVEASDYAIWANRKFSFNSEKLQRVMEKLEHWYGVTIHIGSETLAEQFLTFTIGEESLIEAMEMISRITPFTYKIDNNNNNIYINQ